MLSELKYEDKSTNSKRRASGAVVLAAVVAAAFACWALLAW